VKAKRRRLPADQAQAAILDAAERQLAAQGPDGIRLQELADDLGISHPAILHHFGNRAGLVRAVVKRALGRLQDELMGLLAQRADPQVAATLLGRVFQVLRDGNHARTLAWLYLSRGETSGDPIGHGEQMRRVAELVHGMRNQRRRSPAEFRDTLYTVALADLAVFGLAICEPALRRAGVETDPFLSWLTDRLVEHLDG